MMNPLHVLMLNTFPETLPAGSAGPDPEDLQRDCTPQWAAEQQLVVCRVSLHFDCFLSMPKICSSKAALHFG